MPVSMLHLGSVAYFCVQLIILSDPLYDKMQYSASSDAQLPTHGWSPGQGHGQWCPARNQQVAWLFAQTLA